MIKTSFKLEAQLMEEGYCVVAGLDEVGRGALAGPVGAAVVGFPPTVNRELLAPVTDSKKLTSKMREKLSILIKKKALICETGYSTAAEVDDLGIVEATKLAMLRALEASLISPDYLIIDALNLPESGIDCLSIVKGDLVSTSVAAASIIAKVDRDQLMKNMADIYPNYSFEKNKGYGTSSHIRAIKEFGATKFHRQSFAPISEMISVKT